MNTKKRMLLVEDDAIQQFMAKKILSSRYEIETAADGYEAVELSKNGDFDIILLDINLGDTRMDGVSVMRLIRQNRRYKHTKIIAVTAFRD